MSCSICMNDIIHTNKVVTPCKHTFCNNCLTQWLFTKTSCPMCRKDIGINCYKNLNEEEENEEEENEEEDEIDNISLQELYSGISKCNIHMIDTYIDDFEEIMFELIDNIDNRSYLQSKGTYISLEGDGRTLQRKGVKVNDDIYTMDVIIRDKSKIITANISYDCVKEKSIFIYKYKYKVSKTKIRRVNRLPKNINRHNNRRIKF
jgi:hypothetical protein